MSSDGEDNATALTLTDLPDETIQTVFLHLSLQDLVACQSSCKSLALLSRNVLLWKQQCQTEYRFWHPRHNFGSLLRKPAVDVDWEQLLRTRKNSDLLVRKTLEGVLATSHRRLENIRTVVDLGDDAREALLKELTLAEDAEDVLARKYWIKETLGCMDRHVALDQWVALRTGTSIELERVFGALDLFIAERPAMTLDELTQRLDDLAQAFRTEVPNSDTLSVSDKASAVIRFLRSKGFNQITSGETFRDMQNNLISIALVDPDHPTIPLTCVIIFCCVARRLGIDAHPCGMPGHMRVVVKSSDDRSDDSFFDPWFTENPVPVAALRAELSQTRLPLDLHRYLLAPADTRQMIQRAVGNIQASLRVSHEYSTVLQSPTLPQGIELSPHRASYVTSIIQLLFASSDDAAPPPRQMQLHQFLNTYVTDFGSHFRLDTSLLEKYIIPIFGDGQEREYLTDMANTVRGEDVAPVVVKPRLLNYQGPEALPNAERSPNGAGESCWISIKYPVGTLFRHKRYRYMAAVAGWDNACNMPEMWIEQMQIDRLSRGRAQSFYHALVEDESTRYVAEENIVPVPKGEDGPTEGLLRVAGRSFKRWDTETWRFVSNVKDEYPHD